MNDTVEQRGLPASSLDKIKRAVEPTKRQYTLKGVESETVELMRSAAKHEGMKIGSWVSARLKEAANNALSEECDTVAHNASIQPQAESELKLFQVIESLQRSNSEQRNMILEMNNNMSTLLERQFEIISAFIERSDLKETR